VTPEPDDSTGLLRVVLQDSPHRVVGTVQGSTPVLREINGATFKQPAPLTGPILVYRAKASEPSALPTLTGELLASPPSRRSSVGRPQSQAPAASERGEGVAWRDGEGGGQARGLRGVGVGRALLPSGCWGGGAACSP